jgi:ADP-ribose pyrophosphatase YjhB (NUDIX family)
MSESAFNSSRFASRNVSASRGVYTPRKDSFSLLPHEVDLIDRNKKVHATRINTVFVPFQPASCQENPLLLVGTYGSPRSLSEVICSTYWSPWVDHLFTMTDDVYVIGLTYNKYNRVPQKTYADTQRSITGTIEFKRHPTADWIKETPHEAAIRELQEEVGVSCDVDTLQAPHVTRTENATWYSFAINARSLRATQPGEHQFLEKSRPDSALGGTEKVQIFVYGTNKEIMDMLSNVTSRTVEETDIFGVRLLQSSAIREAFSHRRW